MLILESLNSFEYYTLIILLSLFLFIWILSILWTIRDVFKRSDSFLFQVFSIVLVILLNILGLFIYLCIRPHQTLEEKYDSFWEKELFLKNKKHEFCSNCEGMINPSYLYCPWCKYALKSKCGKCKKEIELGFKWCPFCSTKIQTTKSKKAKNK